MNVSLELLVGCIYAVSQSLLLLIYSLYGFYYIKKRNNEDKSFCGQWIKVVWRLRSVYSSFSVHLFDIVTDLMVITVWWDEEKHADIEHVDTRQMAIISICIIINHKILSSLAFLFSEGSIRRALFQLFDLLILEEIYCAHLMLKSIEKNNFNKKVNYIESTMQFKYIRSLEAIFESTPQAVLQLVYLMRTAQLGLGTGGDNDNYNNVIIFLSILQSITSMTNSVLNDDNTRGMQGKKWKVYKQRIPPSIEFLKHASIRLCQVTSRIFIFALMWTVIGGIGFTVFGIIEVIYVLFLLYLDIRSEFQDWRSTSETNGNLDVCRNAFDELLLHLNYIILLPPELMFYGDTATINESLCGYCMTYDSNKHDCCHNMICCCWLYCSCTAFAAVLTIICSNLCRYILCCGNNYIINRTYLWSSIRYGLTLLEIIFVILFGILDKLDKNEENYLFFKFENGLIIFIVAILCFIIDLSYLQLFPRFTLPNGISARSKYGLAFAGQVTALERIRVPIVTITETKQEEYRDSTTGEIKTRELNVFVDVEDKDFWDEEYGDATCAMYAKANLKYNVVEWLESQGAYKHKEINAETARNIIDRDYDGWAD